MKISKLVAVALCVLAVSLPAYALDSNAVSSAGFSNLTDSQKAEIIKMVADTATKNQEQAKQSISVPTTAKEVNEWVDIGSKIGSGFAAAASSLGVAVNDFAKTPVGTFTIVLIAWNFLGHSLMHFVGGIIIWSVGFSGVYYFARRGASTSITYSKDKTNIFGNARIEEERRGDLPGEYVAGLAILGLVVTLIGCAAFFTG